MVRQNITRSIRTCANPECRSKYHDIDGSGYCENCDPPPEYQYARGAGQDGDDEAREAGKDDVDKYIQWHDSLVEND